MSEFEDDDHVQLNTKCTVCSDCNCTNDEGGEYLECEQNQEYEAILSADRENECPAMGEIHETEEVEE